MAVVHHQTHTPVVTTSAIVDRGFLSAARIIYFALDVIEVGLVIRFILHLLGANPAAPFVALIYSWTAPLLQPFRGILTPITTTGAVFEWSTLIAMAVYAVVAYGLVRLLAVLSGREVEVEVVE